MKMKTYLLTTPDDQTRCEGCNCWLYVGDIVCVLGGVESPRLFCEKCSAKMMEDFEV